MEGRESVAIEREKRSKTGGCTDWLTYQRVFQVYMYTWYMCCGCSKCLPNFLVLPCCAVCCVGNQVLVKSNDRRLV